MKEISTMNQGVQRKPAKSKAITSIAFAVAMVAGGLSSVTAEALVLGQARVLSFIGEPLKAEIPITQLTKDEAASLMVSLASPSDFSSRGLIYTSTLSSMRVSYEVTGNSTAVIHIRSAKPMQDPFVDMLMDVRWRAGNVQRSYTMLIDPPPTMGMVSPNAIIPAGSEITADGTVAPIRVATPTTSTQPTTSFSTLPTTSAPTTATTPDGVVVRERILGSGEGAGANRPSTPVQPTQPTTSTPSSRTPVTSGSDLHVKVERGQTLGKVAAAFKPAGATTEQMLAALYKANPSAFINNNINWLKSGATLRIPTDAEIAAISKTDARSLVGAHARQFNQRRAQMGQTPSQVVPTPPTRPGEGIITPIGTGQKPDSGNELIITAGQDSNTGVDQNHARIQQEAADDARRAEIERHQQELERLKSQMNDNAQSGTGTEPLVVTATDTGTGTTATDTGTGTTATDTGTGTTATDTGTGTAATDTGTGTTATDTGAGTTATDTGTGTTATDTGAGTTATDTGAGTTATDTGSTRIDTTPYVPQKDWIDLVLENLWMIAAGLGAVVVLVGGLLFLRGRKKTVDDGDDSFFQEEDSYYPEDEPGGDSFMLDQSSSIYAASQLDANADVDPVQEADVYLAYGRDEQAAEILRDALSSEPDRVALHAKLCEVYARQNDIIAFEEQAMRLHALTKGQGFEWERISRLAQSISPNKIGMLGSDIPDTRSPITQPAPYNSSASKAAQEDTDTEPMDFMNHEEDEEPQNDNFADLDVSLDFSKSVNPNDDLMNFSDSSSDSPSFAMDGDDDDEGPATRLALAEEFFAIGNKDDAKEIIEEVMRQNISDEDKKRAASLLNKIS